MGNDRDNHQAKDWQVNHVPQRKQALKQVQTGQLPEDMDITYQVSYSKDP